MKRINNLHAKICDYDNIELAFENAKKGKKKYHEVKMIEGNKRFYLEQIHDMLKNSTFTNGKYEIFEKISGNKIRKIYKLPFFPDRIIHHCIVQILEPIWTSLFIRDTYATIPNRGIHDGVKRMKLYMKTKPKYCLKLDVRKFYPSVDHEVLKKLLNKKIKCIKTLDLLYEIIDSAPGIPIGNYLSQWFGNIYLTYLDHFIKEQLSVTQYSRYCDDMVLLSNDKTFLWNCFNKINKELAKLKLDVKSNYQVFPVDVRGIDFLGYRFFHNYTLVRKSIVKNFKHKIIHKGEPHDFAAYWGWFKHADTYNLVNKYFNMHSFSDFAKISFPLSGEKKRIADIINMEIQISDFRIKASKHTKGDYLAIQFKANDNKEYVCFTGSTVLINQCIDYKGEIPFKTTIKVFQNNGRKYYSFT